MSVSDEVVSAGTSGADASPMKGMTITAWSAEAYNSANFDESIANLANVGAEWVTFTVFWFMNTSSATQIYRRPDLYTSSDSSLIHAIQKAHGLNMNVALKPMVDVVDGSWRGTINPSNWTLWFENYRNFTDYYADLARTNNVELFTVGTELRSSQSYESEWREVINETRTRFSGNVTYAANWDSYSIYARLPGYAVKFWDALDYVGVDAYFPLTNSFNPTLEQLKGAWSNSTAAGWWGTGFNWTNELYSTYTSTGKKIVFTEIGYISQNGTNTQPWTGFTPAHEIDLQEQADCYQACLEVFKDKPWFMGWFWWNWETDPNAGGQNDDWYTPQNKPAQNVLNQYYSPDIALINITFTKTVVSQGYFMNISITAENAGYSAEAFNVTAYANTTIIATFMNVSLTSGNTATLNFTWNTTGFVKGSYGISAYAWPVSGETNIANNNLTGGLVKVSIPGDVVDPYFKVDMGDISAVLDAFGSRLGADGYYWHKPPGPLDPHSPNMDIDNNGQVDMGDVSIALDNFGNHFP